MKLGFEQKKYVCLSSSIFALPAIYALYRGIMYYPYINAAITLASLNYWRNPENDWRRTIDMSIAHGSFVYYFIDGYRNLKNITFLFGVLCTCNMGYNYLYSHFLYKCENKNWWKFHIMFHLHVIFQQMLILYHL